jgi:hypothetical protein
MDIFVSLTNEFPVYVYPSSLLFLPSSLPPPSLLHYLPRNKAADWEAQNDGDDTITFSHCQEEGLPSPSSLLPLSPYSPSLPPLTLPGTKQQTGKPKTTETTL